MSKEIRIPVDEVAALLEEVRMELSAGLAKNEDLVKAEDEKKSDDKPKDDGPPAEAKEDKDPAAEVSGGDSAPKEDVAPEAPPAVAADPVDDSAMAAPDAMSPEASADAIAPDAAMDPAADGAIQPAPTVAELQAEYDKLSDEELAMHVMAAKAAASARNAAAAPVAPAPMAPPAPANPMPPEMALKTEIKKSESDLKIEALEQALAEAKANVEKQTKAIEDLVEYVSKPVRKSLKYITEIEAPVVEKPVSELSKSEITEKLNRVSRDPSLKKSDRELINGFYSGEVKVDALAHLLK